MEEHFQVLNSTSQKMITDSVACYTNHSLSSFSVTNFPYNSHFTLIHLIPLRPPRIHLQYFGFGFGQFSMGLGRTNISNRELLDASFWRRSRHQNLEKTCWRRRTVAGKQNIFEDLICDSLEKKNTCAGR